LVVVALTISSGLAFEYSKLRDIVTLIAIAAAVAMVLRQPLNNYIEELWGMIISKCVSIVVGLYKTILKPCCSCTYRYIYI
jgi:hypothetical protein